jgi:hypothetical protein
MPTLIVTVTGALLAVAGQTVPHDLMGYAAITDEADGSRNVFDHRLMTTFQNHLREPRRGVAGDLVFGLIADATGLLDKPKSFGVYEEYF